MAINTPVVDRVPTYPGRVKLTPVSGQANTYDLVRADQPIAQGTLLNKALLDQKAYTLTKNVTLYVATTGNDTSGDGTSTKPYKTINRAIADIPKFLGGFQATVDIAAGTYDEIVTITGFSGGILKLGMGAARAVSVKGIDISDSRTVQISIPNVAYTGSGTPVILVDIRNGSDVDILTNLKVTTATGADKTGIAVRGGSTMRATSSALTFTGFAREALWATGGSNAAIYSASGSVSGWRFAATFGSQIRFGSATLTSTKGDGYSWGSNITSGAGNYVESGVG